MEVKGKICAIAGDNIYPSINFKKEIYVLDEIQNKTYKNKIIEALKMVNLNEEYLLKKSNDLSDVEYRKLSLAKDLLNKDKVIYLNYFEKGLCFKEREYFKKLFKKLSKEYGIDFIFKTNDFSFCIDLVDEYYIFENNECVDVIPKEKIYEKKVYKYFNRHQLIDFVIKSRKHNHLMENYYDINEILKAIYRELK